MSISDFRRSLSSSLFGSSTVASEQLFLKHYFVSNRYSVAQCGVADNYKLLLPPCPPNKLSALIWATVMPSAHLYFRNPCSAAPSSLPSWSPQASWSPAWLYPLHGHSHTCGYLCYPLQWIFSSVKSGTML